MLTLHQLISVIYVVVKSPNIVTKNDYICIYRERKRERERESVLYFCETKEIISVYTHTQREREREKCMKFSKGWQ